MLAKRCSNSVNNSTERTLQLVWLIPTTTLPLHSCLLPVKSAFAALIWLNIIRACCSKQRPASVNSTPRKSRSNNFIFSSCSRFANCRLMAGCATSISFAAEVMLPCSAVAKKYCNCLVFIAYLV